jgi:hypothetical protein
LVREADKVAETKGSLERLAERAGHGTGWVGCPWTPREKPAGAAANPVVNREESGTENFIDLGGELEIEVADALNTVGIEIDDDLIPNVAPFRMMVHGFGHKSDLGHLSEGRDKIFTLEGFVEFAAGEAPTGGRLQMKLNFGIG